MIMSNTAKRAPEPADVVVMPRTRDVKRELERQYDKENPDYKHIWKSVEASQVEIDSLKAEIVHGPDGKAITHGTQQLFRVPVKRWRELASQGAIRSRERVRQVVGSTQGSVFVDGGLDKYRSPKRSVEK